MPSGSDPPPGNPQNSVSFWQKWHTQIGLSEERVSVASSRFPKAFSFLAALWVFISNDGVFIVVMQQSFQRAISPNARDKTVKGSNETDSCWQFPQEITCLCMPWKSMVMIEGLLFDPAAKNTLGKYNYLRQRSWVEVMFSPLFVCLSACEQLPDHNSSCGVMKLAGINCYVNMWKWFNFERSRSSKRPNSLNWL